MMQTGFKLSYHAMEERIERIGFIGAKVGFGTTVLIRQNEGQDTQVELTDTGVIIVRTVSDNTIVTMYLADIDTARYVIGDCDNCKKLMQVVKRNIKLGLVAKAMSIKA